MSGNVRDLIEALMAAFIMAAIVMGLGLLAKYVIGPIGG
jgi:Tfp pilus assembly protein PilV